MKKEKGNGPKKQRNATMRTRLKLCCSLGTRCTLYSGCRARAANVGGPCGRGVGVERQSRRQIPLRPTVHTVDAYSNAKVFGPTRSVLTETGGYVHLDSFRSQTSLHLDRICPKRTAQPARSAQACHCSRSRGGAHSARAAQRHSPSPRYRTSVDCVSPPSAGAPLSTQLRHTPATTSSQQTLTLRWQ